MKVRFITNLGSRDAERFGVDHTKCVVDAEVEVSKDAGEAMLAQGVCVAVAGKKVKAVPKAAKVRGVEEGEQFLKDYKKEESKKDA